MMERGNSDLITDHSHGPAILLAVEVDVGWVYVDATRSGHFVQAGIEVSRTDGSAVELTSREQADALCEAIRCAATEVWADSDE